jgi:hypothetical protein
MMLTNRLRPWLAAAGLATLVACGGGGGGSDDSAAASQGPTLEAPPTTAAALQTTSVEASGAAAAGMESAQRMVQLSASLSGSIPALANSGSAALSWSRAALSASRERALARQTVSCAEFFDAPSSSCSGSLTVDTNHSGSGTVIPAGTYVSMSFNGLQGSFFDDSQVSINGTLRIDYLSALDTNAPSVAGLRTQLTFSNFSGSTDGVPFGPLTEVARYEFDNQGVGTMTIDGLRIVGFDTIQVTDANNYIMNDVMLSRAHWATPTGYVNMQFSSWYVVNGRPTLDSTVTITAPNSSITVRVTSSSASSVVYAVTAIVNGASVSYTVTASYPANGAPTYAAVPTPI